MKHQFVHLHTQGNRLQRNVIKSHTIHVSNDDFDYEISVKVRRKSDKLLKMITENDDPSTDQSSADSKNGTQNVKYLTNR